MTREPEKMHLYNDIIESLRSMKVVAVIAPRKTNHQTHFYKEGDVVYSGHEICVCQNKWDSFSWALAHYHSNSIPVLETVEEFLSAQGIHKHLKEKTDSYLLYEKDIAGINPIVETVKISLQPLVPTLTH